MQSNNVDILLATHNGERFIRHQIRSIQSQSHGSWRLLVSDDNSSDKTVKIIEEMVLTDDRIKIVSKEKYGSPQANFISLIHHSNADYSFFCDQDDVWDREKVEKLLSVAQTMDPERPSCISSDARLIDESGKTLSDSFLSSSKIAPDRTNLRRVITQNPVLGCTSMINRATRELVSSVQLNTSQIIMHDWWVALISSALGELRVLAEPLVSYRQHRANEIGAVKYSLTSLYRALPDGTAKTDAIFDQARYFQGLYADMLSDESREALNEFCDLFSSPRITRPFLLASGHYLKKGALRASGQMYFAMKA